MPGPSLKFRPRQRLTQARQFEAVYAGKISRAAAPLVVYGLPNVLGYCRLGLSVGRRAGNAPTRNGCKRRIREAFRHIQHEVDALSLDVVVSVRAHEPLKAEEYRKRLRELIEKVARDWKERVARG